MVLDDCDYNFRDFNPRSREGSDVAKKSATISSVYFNPRSREGSDRKRLLIMQCIVISIRAPARGATGLIKFITGVFTDFNPRSREGSDINFRQKVLFSLSKNCVIHLFFITNFLN